MTQSILTDPLLTHSAKNGVFGAVLSGPRKKTRTGKSRPDKHFQLTAGERIRTADVQLGKHIPTLTEKLGKPVFPVS